MDKRRGRVVRNEMTGELCRDGLRGRRMAGEVGEPCTTLPGPGIVVILADDGLWARLVGALDVDEFAALIGVRYSLPDCPAGQDFGEIGHVALTVSRAHPEGMQFEDLARQILLDALAPIDAAHPLQPHR